jgi:hypothetical protein
VIHKNHNHGEESFRYAASTCCHFLIKVSHQIIIDYQDVCVCVCKSFLCLCEAFQHLSCFKKFEKIKKFVIERQTIDSKPNLFKFELVT